MKIKCDYCGSFINDYDEKCPNCGATNEHLVRKAIGSPKTIEELKLWYEQHNLPPEETTRFFIGKDYKKPRAFGIYKDENTGNFVVYKNKDTGQRAIRYEGKDEAYAVNELYLKLKEEIINQKTRNLNRSRGRNNNAVLKINPSIIAIFIFCIIIFLTIFIFASNSSKDGYYNYGGTYYYHQGWSWYEYDGSWRKAEYVPNELKDTLGDYFESY